MLVPAMHWGIVRACSNGGEIKRKYHRAGSACQRYLDRFAVGLLVDPWLWELDDIQRWTGEVELEDPLPMNVWSAPRNDRLQSGDVVDARPKAPNPSLLQLRAREINCNCVQSRLQHHTIILSWLLRAAKVAVGMCTALRFGLSVIDAPVHAGTLAPREKFKDRIGTGRAYRNRTVPACSQWALTQAIEPAI